MKFHRLEIDRSKDNVVLGNRVFEIRRFDWGYRVGDYAEFDTCPGRFFQIVYVLHERDLCMWATIGMKEVGGGFFDEAEKIALGNGIKFSDGIHPELAAPVSALRGKRLRKWQMVLVLRAGEEEALGAFQILEIRISDGNSARGAHEIPEHCDGNARILLERVRDERK